MNRVTKFLNDCGAFYLATADGDQPRVRPFGAVSEFEGKLYFCTNNQKDVSRQMKQNPKVEICGFAGKEWVRLTGRAIADPRREAKAAMLEANPGLNNMYNLDDGIFEVFYLSDATAVFSAFGAESETIRL